MLLLNVHFEAVAMRYESNLCAWKENTEKKEEKKKNKKKKVKDLSNCPLNWMSSIYIEMYIWAAVRC